MKRRCKNCDKSIIEKRIVAKFCSNACRAEFWRNLNEKGKQVPLEKQNHSLSPIESQPTVNKLDSVITGLKGIVTDGNASKKIKLSKKETSEYISLNQRSIELKRVLTINTNNLLKLEHQQETQEREIEMIFPIIGTGLGFAVDLPKTKKGKKGKPNRENPLLRGLIIALGLVGGTFIGKSQKQSRLKSLEKTKKIIQTQKGAIARQRVNLAKLMLEISNTQRYSIDKNEKIMESNQLNNSREERLDYDVVPTNEVDLNDKIISSNELKKMNFRSLDFKGKWELLFGKPAISFHLVIHGKPGQGKSTFSLQFANYLASNFGKVLYVSGEEGFSKTMKDKFKENNAYNDNLYLADIHSFETLREIVKPDTYHFIFIDSLNNMGIDIEQLKGMRELYKNSTLVTISQSTKKGELRGSQEIEHESDISLKIEDGFAFATKNRFKGLGYEYSIFENYS